MDMIVGISCRRRIASRTWTFAVYAPVDYAITFCKRRKNKFVAETNSNNYMIVFIFFEKSENLRHTLNGLHEAWISSSFSKNNAAQHDEGYNDDDAAYGRIIESVSPHN